MTKDQLTVAASIDSSNIRSYETGRASMNLRSLCRIAEALDMAPGDFLEGVTGCLEHVHVFNVNEWLVCGAGYVAVDPDGLVLLDAGMPLLAGVTSDSPAMVGRFPGALRTGDAGGRAPVEEDDGLDRFRPC